MQSASYSKCPALCLEHGRAQWKGKDGAMRPGGGHNSETNPEGRMMYTHVASCNSL